MSEIVKFSNSELQTFKQCKRKWWLAYYRGLRPKAKRIVGAMALGTRIHDALEAFYVPPSESPVNPLETFASGVEADLEAHPEEEERIEKQAELGRIMLEGYLDWLEETGADSQLEVIASEEAIEYTWGEHLGKTLVFMGKLDVRVMDKFTGARKWLDHKTTTSIKRVLDISHMNEQFKSYSLLEWLMAKEEDEWADGGIINILRTVKRTANAKPPFYHREPVHYNDHLMRDMYRRIDGTIKDIVNLRFWLDHDEEHQSVAYPTPSNDCTWKCEFYAVCPIIDEDERQSEAFIENYFETGDPYERYSEDDETD